MEDNLHYQQYRALCVLIAGGSVEAAAQAGEVSVAAIKKWKQHPTFKRKLKDAIVKVYDAALAEIVLGAKDAVRELNSIIINPETSDRVKVTAIGTLLTHAANAKQLVIDERVAALEVALNGDETTTR